jgi:probable F420-dependent oxidoreductase
MPNTIKYALYLPNHGLLGDARILADLAAEAESVGWDGFFLWDHVAAEEEETRQSKPVVDPWVALTAVAMVTTNLRIGTTVTPVPRRRPWKLAREAVSLDRLSNGRLVLGVGIGLGEMEWHDLGEETDPRVRGAMLDESLEILIGLWSGEPFSYEGQHYHIRKAHFIPEPTQKPRIPIWVGGVWPNKAPFRRMAKWDGMFPLFSASGPERIGQLKEALDYVKKERQALGMEGAFDVANLGITPGGDSETTALRVREAVDAGVTWWLELIMPEIFGPLTDEEVLAAIRLRVQQGMPGM